MPSPSPLPRSRGCLTTNINMSDIRKENGKENGKEKGKESKLYTAQELATMVKSLRKEVRSLKTLVAEKDEELAAVKVSYFPLCSPFCVPQYFFDLSDIFVLALFSFLSVSLHLHRSLTTTSSHCFLHALMFLQFRYFPFLRFSFLLLYFSHLYSSFSLFLFPLSAPERNIFYLPGCVSL